MQIESSSRFGGKVPNRCYYEKGPKRVYNRIFMSSAPGALKKAPFLETSEKQQCKAAFSALDCSFLPLGSHSVGFLGALHDMFLLTVWVVLLLGHHPVKQRCGRTDLWLQKSKS